jgi:hypothetical protein
MRKVYAKEKKQQIEMTVMSKLGGYKTMNAIAGYPKVLLRVCARDPETRKEAETKNEANGLCACRLKSKR